MHLLFSIHNEGYPLLVESLSRELRRGVPLLVVLFQVLVGVRHLPHIALEPSPLVTSASFALSKLVPELLTHPLRVEVPVQGRDHQVPFAMVQIGVHQEVPS